MLLLIYPKKKKTYVHINDKGVYFILEFLHDHLAHYKLRVKQLIKKKKEKKKEESKQPFNSLGLAGYDPCLYSLSLECLLVLLSLMCCSYNHNCHCQKK